MRYLKLGCVIIAAGATTLAALHWRELQWQRALDGELLQPRAASGWHEGDSNAVGFPSDSSLGSVAESHAMVPVTGNVSTAQAPNQVSLQERLKDPDSRAEQLSSIKSRLPGRYRELTDELNLAPEAADAFFDLLAEHELELMAVPVPEVDEAMGHQAQVLGGPALQVAGANREQAVRAMLGEAGYETWTEFHSSVYERGRALALGGKLDAMGEPLTAQQ